MFYPVDSLKRGGRFYLCWVADSWPLRFATITHRQLWSQDIRQICDDLMEVLNNESGRSTNRFSLRLSSQLLRGLVRLYHRKVTVFVGDLCMINAHVMKLTNKRWANEVTTHEGVERRPQLPLIFIEEQKDEERVAERIQNSGNVVANIEDITLKEPTIPENRHLLDDGFGELPGERSVEMMLGGEHGSVLSTVEVSARSELSERSRSMLARSFTHDQIEGIAEHDLTVFGKSMGEITMPTADIEKDIPEISNIPLPDLPAPEPLNQTIEVEKRKENEIEPIEKIDVIHKPTILEPEEVVLEELVEEPQVKRRRLKKKLIIDKNTKLSSDFMVSRIECVNVEQRCEDSSDDIINLLVPAAIYLNRPAHAGQRVRSNLGYTCTRLFTRNLGIMDRLPFADREIEEAMTAQRMRPVLEIIEEESPVQKISDARQLQELSALEGGSTDKTREPSAMEFAELPTQRLMASPTHKRSSELAISPKRFRHSGYVSFRETQRLKEDISGIEANKENIPVSDNIPVPENIPISEIIPVPENILVSENIGDYQRGAERLTALLVAEGLADFTEAPGAPARATLAGAPRPRAWSENSDTTLLGSLDRTKVSLGESDATTDSKRFIRDEWGTEGTMHKIFRFLRRGVQRLDVARLIAEGPVRVGYTRISAARCFTSILKLKQHGFIEIHKDSVTCEIINITLGSKLV